MSAPTAEQIAAARWFGGKGGVVTAVAELDRLELDGAALRVLEVSTDDGGSDRYLWTDGDVGQQLVALAVDGVERGAFRFEPAAGLEPCSGERPIGHDQSNTSLVVGERIVAKLYRRLERGTHPEIELGAHLTARRVDSVPAYRGSAHWDGHPLMLLQDYVAGATDGWSWAAELARSGSVEGLDEVGRTVAQLERALAGLGSRMAADAELNGWADDAQSALYRAIELAGGSARALLVEHTEAIAARLEGLRVAAPPPEVTRVHGDLHIGQVLRAPGDRLVVVDFEGEPSKPLMRRTLPGPPVRDVAAMLRSFDHVARWQAIEGWDGGVAGAERWIADARVAFLGGYGSVDERVLHAFEVEKECYEYTYAGTYLPEWMPVAEGGMRWLLERQA